MPLLLFFSLSVKVMGQRLGTFLKLLICILKLPFQYVLLIHLASENTFSCEKFQYLCEMGK